MRRIDVENYSPEQVREHVVKAIDLADELADRDLAAWRAIFRAAYDGYSAKQIVLEQEAPVNMAALLGNGRG